MDRRIFFVLGGVILVVAFIVLLKKCSGPKECQGVVFDASPRTIILGSGQNVLFTDNTPNAKSWFWDFGDNKGTAAGQNPSYQFDKAGRYVVHLTVNGSCKDTLSILVKSLEVDSDKIQISIDAPTEGDVGAPIQFKANAPAKKWRWYFGETSKVDDTTQNPTHVYKSPNAYKVLLKTDVAHKQAEWTVNIMPKKKVIIKAPVITMPKPHSAPQQARSVSPPPPPPATTGVIKSDEITARLNIISKQTRISKDDKQWISDNFILGHRTAVKVTGSFDIQTLDDLLDLMTINPGTITVKSVSPTYDKARGVVSSLTVNISQSK